ncbi:MAG: hypothetical protein MHPSP_003873, partial [Paramarteilia canceri]
MVMIIGLIKIPMVEESLKQFYGLKTYSLLIDSSLKRILSGSNDVESIILGIRT